MSRRKGPNRLQERTLRITRKGHAVLRAVEAGTYKFATTGRPQNCHGRKPR